MKEALSCLGPWSWLPVLVTSCWALWSCSASAPATPPQPNLVELSTCGPPQPHSTLRDLGSRVTAAAASSLTAQKASPLLPEPRDEMVRVPAGEFVMGCSGNKDCRDDEGPSHRVYLDAFEIDIHEVSVEDYKSCVQMGFCDGAVGLPNLDGRCNWGVANRQRHPINCVRWRQAREYCAWRHKHLPTEAQWERAARGIDQRSFPWGEGPPPDSVCWNRGMTCEVGRRPADVSPTGAEDMAGNVAEWVRDRYFPWSYRQSARKNPKGWDRGGAPGAYGPCGYDACRILRGGGAFDELSTLRSAARHPADEASENTGFRCAREVAEATSP